MTVEQIIINLSKYPKDMEVIYNNVVAMTENGLTNLSENCIGYIPEDYALRRWLQNMGEPYGWEIEETIEWDDDIDYILSKTVDGIEYKIHTYDGNYYTVHNDKEIIEVGLKEFDLILDIIKDPVNGIKLFEEL